MRAMRAGIMVTMAMAIIGIEARGSTCKLVLAVVVSSGKAGFQSYFADGSMKGKTSIPSKRPDHARCGGEEPDDRTPGKGDYDRSHHRRSSFRLDSVIEDLDERETSR